MRTLSDILTDVNSVMDLEASAPTGDELSTRTNYANQAVWDAAATGQLSEFKAEYLVNTSTLATIAMPSNYRELMVNPQVLDSTGEWNEWDVIEAEAKYDYASTDRYCYQLGNPNEGYSLVFNALFSMSTLSVVYQRYPSGLATLTDTCELSDPQVVTRKVESYVLYSRGDDRFPIAEQRSEKQLANMMGREMKSSTGQSRDTKMKFRHPLKDLS